jgi:Beta-carotene isomerase D27-like, C-terminal
MLRSASRWIILTILFIQLTNLLFDGERDINTTTTTTLAFTATSKQNRRCYTKKMCHINLALYVMNQTVAVDLLLSSSSVSKLNGITTPKTTRMVIGTDPMTKPDYDTMIGPLGKFVDILCMTHFRNKLRDQVLMNDKREADSADPIYYGPIVTNYTQIVQLAAAMNAKYKTQPQLIQYRAYNVLCNLFPSWLPKWYTILFSKPFPRFAAKMNAYVTAAVGVWLMGECTINDIIVPSFNNDTTIVSTTSIGMNQGVSVTRCRFLEESQCASICVNSCKIPTQKFFLEQMGIPLLMEPNYTSGSCQFSFGIYPNTTTENIAMSTPCLSRCPTFGSYRQNHHNHDHLNPVFITAEKSNVTSPCSMMENSLL